MRAAFHQAGNHHGMAARQPAHGAGMVEFAQPAVARLVAPQRPRLARIFRRHGCSQVHHAYVRIRRQARQRQRGAKRVFFLAQMADHGDQAIAARRCLPFHLRHRLENDARLVALGGGQFLQALRLQHHHAIGQLKRLFRAGVGANVTVKVGAGEHQNQRPPRVGLFECLDRGMAAPCMQGDEQIAILARPGKGDDNAMAKGAQMPRPAQRGITIAVARARWCRRYNDDSHEWSGSGGRRY